MLPLYWSFVRKTILDARPKSDAFLVDESLNSLNPHPQSSFKHHVIFLMEVHAFHVDSKEIHSHLSDFCVQGKTTCSEG